MARIHIHRPHHLGLQGARKVAWQWAEQAEADFDMACTYAEGPEGDEVQFSRTGVSGTLTVGADNLLNEYPEQAIFANSTSGLIPYSLYSPFGFNGRYLYGRAAYTW